MKLFFKRRVYNRIACETFRLQVGSPSFTFNLGMNSRKIKSCQLALHFKTPFYIYNGQIYAQVTALKHLAYTIGLDLSYYEAEYLVTASFRKVLAEHLVKHLGIQALTPSYKNYKLIAPLFHGVESYKRRAK